MGVFTIVLSIINIVILGTIAVVSVVLVKRLAPVLRGLRRTVDEEINPFIAQVRGLVEETRPKIDSITQRVEAMADEEIKPLTSNVKEITGNVNEEVAKVSGIVDTVSDMVSRTHEVVSLYQDKAVIPAIEMISLWDGIKKGASVLFRREKHGGGDPNG
jgi:uncharacterized protein YoxC